VTSKAVFCLSSLLPTCSRHHARLLYPIFRKLRQASTRCLEPHMRHKSHAANVRKGSFLRYLSILVYPVRCCIEAISPYRHSGRFPTYSVNVAASVAVIPNTPVQIPSIPKHPWQATLVMGHPWPHKRDFRPFRVTPRQYVRCHLWKSFETHCCNSVPRGGSSLGDLFVFDGPLEPSDRHEGRTPVFGADVEILKADRQGAATSSRVGRGKV